MEKFKDFDPVKIANKLKQVEEFEAKYGSNNLTRAWYKWCTSYDYRKKEWEWRQALANANKELNENPLIFALAMAFFILFSVSSITVLSCSVSRA